MRFRPSLQKMGSIVPIIRVIHLPNYRRLPPQRPPSIAHTQSPPQGRDPNASAPISRSPPRMRFGIRKRSSLRNPTTPGSTGDLFPSPAPVFQTLPLPVDGTTNHETAGTRPSRWGAVRSYTPHPPSQKIHKIFRKLVTRMVLVLHLLVS